MNVNDVRAAAHVCYSLAEPMPIYHWTTSTKCEDRKFHGSTTQRRCLATNTPKGVHIVSANECNMQHLQCAPAPDVRYELKAIVILNSSRPTRTCAIVCRSAHLLRHYSVLVHNTPASLCLHLCPKLFLSLSRRSFTHIVKRMARICFVKVRLLYSLRCDKF